MLDVEKQQSDTPQAEILRRRAENSQTSQHVDRTQEEVALAAIFVRYSDTAHGRWSMSYARTEA